VNHVNDFNESIPAFYRTYIVLVTQKFFPVALRSWSTTQVKLILI